MHCDKCSIECVLGKTAHVLPSQLAAQHPAFKSLRCAHSTEQNQENALADLSCMHPSLHLPSLRMHSTLEPDRHICNVLPAFACLPVFQPLSVPFSPVLGLPLSCTCRGIWREPKNTSLPGRTCSNGFKASLSQDHPGIIDKPYSSSDFETKFHLGQNLFRFGALASGPVRNRGTQ